MVTQHIGQHVYLEPNGFGIGCGFDMQRKFDWNCLVLLSWQLHAVFRMNMTKSHISSERKIILDLHNP